MRRTFIVAIGTAVALATAAVAIAVTSTSGVSTTTGTFAAGKEKANTRVCTGADGKTFELTKGHYTGIMAFSPVSDLNGTLRIHAKTTYSTTDSLGYVEGSFRVKDGDSRVSGKLSGTLSGTNFVGFLTGKARGKHARIVGNISAVFDPKGAGFSGGMLGAGGSTAVMAVIGGPACKGDKSKSDDDDQGKDKRDESSKSGKATSLEGVLTFGAGAITVTKNGRSTACALDAKSPAITFQNGTKVEIKCELVNNVLTLRSIKQDD